MQKVQKTAKRPKVEVASYKGKRFPLWMKAFAARF